MRGEANSATAFGIELPPLTEKEVPLEAIVLLKVLDGEGETGIVIRCTDGFSIWERVGALMLALDRTREAAQDGWTEEGEDEEE